MEIIFITLNDLNSLGDDSMQLEIVGWLRGTSAENDIDDGSRVILEDADKHLKVD